VGGPEVRLMSELETALLKDILVHVLRFIETPRLVHDVRLVSKRWKDLVALAMGQDDRSVTITTPDYRGFVLGKMSCGNVDGGDPDSDSDGEDSDESDSSNIAEDQRGQAFASCFPSVPAVEVKVRTCFVILASAECVLFTGDEQLFVAGAIDAPQVVDSVETLSMEQFAAYHIAQTDHAVQAGDCRLRMDLHTGRGWCARTVAATAKPYFPLCDQQSVGGFHDQTAPPAHPPAVVDYTARTGTAQH
jgi:hypothetical protein